MFQFLSRIKNSPRPRVRRPSIASQVEGYEDRLLLSATAVPAEIAFEQPHHEAPAIVHNQASLGNYDGTWQLNKTSFLVLSQSGHSVTGTQKLLSFDVGTFTGKVHGDKLTGTITYNGIDATSTIKVKLTDGSHFQGQRHYYVNGASQGTQAFVGVKN